MVSKTVPDIVSKKEANLLEPERHDTGKHRWVLVPWTYPEEAIDRFRENSEKATGFRRNGEPTCVGISGRHRSEYAAPDQDRSPTQQTERNAPSPDSSCERFHEELLWCFREHHSPRVVMRLALLIEAKP